MKQTLREILSRWNGGTYRGAQRKLSKVLGINEATVSLWMMGRAFPGEKLQDKMANLFGVGAEAIGEYFQKPTTPKMTYDLHKKRGVISVDKSTAGSKELYFIHLDSDLAEKFKDLCARERREPSAQIEIILEQYFAQRERPAVDDSTIVPSSTGIITSTVKIKKQLTLDNVKTLIYNKTVEQIGEPLPQRG
jgi:transcriptional regulator with XRE-family HTH domain